MMKISMSKKLGVQLGKKGQAIFDKPVVYRACMGCLRMLMAFFLSRTVIFGSYAPFGVGMVAASGGGLMGLFALAGSAAGLVPLIGKLDVFKYIAIMVLVFCSNLSFRNTQAAAHLLFRPLVATATGTVVGMVFLLGDGITLTLTLLMITEITLMMGTSFFFRAALERQCEDNKFVQSAAVLILAACLLMAASDWTVFEILHPARIAGGVFVLLCAFRGGAGSGSASGLSMGVAMDFGLGYPYFSMAYGVSGLMAGMFKYKKKLICTIIYVVSAGIAALWADRQTLRVAAILETFVASVFFIMIPDTLVFNGLEGLQEKSGDTREGYQRRYTYRRLEQSSSAFRDLYSFISNAFENVNKKNDQDISIVFHNTAEKLCRKCEMKTVCWTKESTGTSMALASASNRITEGGRVTAKDFPEYFSSRCVKFPYFVASVNDETDALLMRRQYKSRLRDSRILVTRQYAEMSKILANVANEVENGVEFDRQAEKRVSNLMKRYALEAQAYVYKDMSGRKRAELEGENIGLLLQENRTLFLRQLSMCVGFPVSSPEHICNTKGERMIFSEAEVLSVNLGVASHQKKGENMSGDSATYFKTADGKLYVLLSDGMGSGLEAAISSSQAIKLLERFLRAGIQPDVALSTLNSALILKEDVSEGFVTVDLLIIDLLNGESKFYKQGASPSYIRRGKKVSRIHGKALPSGVGVGLSTAVDMTACSLAEGEAVLMFSDGVIGYDNDDWLVNIFSKSQNDTPKELAYSVLKQAALRLGNIDDMTVIAVCINKSAK